MAGQAQVQLFAGHASLNPAIQVIAINLKNLVHLGHIQANTTAHRSNMSFQRGTGTKGHQGGASAGTEADYLADLLRTDRIGHRIGRPCCMERLVFAMLLAQTQMGADPVTEQLAQRRLNSGAESGGWRSSGWRSSGWRG